MIIKEVWSGEFSFFSFYKRRAARLLPALAITLFAVFSFGFVFYSGKQFDNLGKEIFFSAFGAANILFAQGVNYFAQDQVYQPLIHLWSLGVEEQFYVLWPIMIILVFKISRRLLFPVAIFLFVGSLFLSVKAVSNDYSAGYFLPHYRAFELLIGCILALWLQFGSKLTITESLQRIFGATGLILVVASMILLNKESGFPGFNALWPCLGSALIIASPVHAHRSVTAILSNRVMVFFGLISYPLYLYHQPIISFVHFFDYSFSPLQLLVFVVFLSTALSWLTYRYVELPVRKGVGSENKVTKFMIVSGLVATIPLFAAAGLVVAKTNGFESRFGYLNPYALEVTQAHGTSFHQKFNRGFSVGEADKKILFVGDSVLQQYVFPISRTLAVEVHDVDTVTRGGCVLLKGVDFEDQFSDISCNDLREQLYTSKKRYDVVVISQLWNGYQNSVKNFPEKEGLSRWKPFLDDTVLHFKNYSENIIIIGAHPSVSGTLGLQPSLTSTTESVSDTLGSLEVNNLNYLDLSYDFFVKYLGDKNVKVIYPKDIFCADECIMSNGEWSYFSDANHISNASTDFVSGRLKELID